jgi:hypothetical protein
VFRLIKDWSSNGIKLHKGVSFKELPKEGIFSKIPSEYFEEYSPVKFEPKKRAKKEKKIADVSGQSPEQIARVSKKKI